MPTIDAGTNPALANQIINSVLNDSSSVVEDVHEADLQPLPETVIDLPGGLVTPTGEVVTEAEVRELTGRDEEAIARTASRAATLQIILNRGVVRIGDAKADEPTLDKILSGDRDMLLLAIYAATFGREVTVTPFCNDCQERVEAEIDIIDATPVKRLASMSDRTFTVETTKGNVTATLPTGKVQREMMLSSEKTTAELSTILLQGCIVEINDMPILNPSKVLDLSIRDRRKIADEIVKRTPGPQMQDITAPCPKCGETLEVPLSLAALFQF